MHFGGKQKDIIYYKKVGWALTQPSKGQETTYPCPTRYAVIVKVCTKASINIRLTGYVTAFSEFNDIRQVGRTAFKELLGMSFPIRVYLKTVRLDIKIRYPVVYCATVMESAVLVKVSKSATIY